MLKLIKTDPKGKETPYVFANKRDREQYVEICEKLWGCVPCDVDWAIGTKLYQTIIKEVK